MNKITDPKKYFSAAVEQDNMPSCPQCGSDLMPAFFPLKQDVSNTAIVYYYACDQCNYASWDDWGNPVPAVYPKRKNVPWSYPH